MLSVANLSAILLCLLIYFLKKCITTHLSHFLSKILIHHCYKLLYLLLTTTSNMFFVEYFNKHKIRQYNKYYIDVEYLLTHIKNEEHNFISKIDDERAKVINFVSDRKNKIHKMAHDIDVSITEMNDGSDNFKSEKNKKILKKCIKRISCKVKAMANFLKINISGFKFILKKYDSENNANIYFPYKENISEMKRVGEIDSLLYKVSKFVLLTKNKEELKPENNENNSKFIRKTDKYWVHMENIDKLKTLIIQNLPVYVHKDKPKNNNSIDSTLDRSSMSNKNDHSSYIDQHNSNVLTNGSFFTIPDMNCYTNGIPHVRRNINSSSFNQQQNKNIDCKIENANSSPYSHYNYFTHDTTISSVYLDNSNFEIYQTRMRKLHMSECIRIRWYTATSKPEFVFVERKLHVDGWTGYKSTKTRFKIPEKYVNAYINGENVWKEVEKLTNEPEETYILYKEIQESIITKNLKPTVRTFYKRSAFQLPNDATVRLSLDTKLCMLKETTEYDLKRDKRPIQWRRYDVGTEYPFKNLHKHEIVRFPYAILEVKTKLLDERKPEWIERIIKSKLVEHVHKFSKFMHGTAVLFPEIIDIPYWLPQFNADLMYGLYSEVNVRNNSMTRDNYQSISQMDRGSFNKETIDHGRDVKWYGDVLMKMSPDKSPEILESGASLIPVDNRQVVVPVRVEPKVFFANERTFLSWLHFSIFIGGLGTAMMGLGDQRAVYSGLVFMGVSLLFAIYALYLYFWRAKMIRRRSAGPYDDFFGPAVLVVVFICAMLLSIYFEFPLK